MRILKCRESSIRYLWWNIAFGIKKLSFFKKQLKFKNQEIYILIYKDKTFVFISVLSSSMNKLFYGNYLFCGEWNTLMPNFLKFLDNAFYPEDVFRDTLNSSQVYIDGGKK